MAVRIKTDIRRWLQELDKKYFLVMLGFSAFVFFPLIALRLTNTVDGLWTTTEYMAGTWELSNGRWFWLVTSFLRFSLQLEPINAVVCLVLVSLGVTRLHGLFKPVREEGTICLDWLAGLCYVSSTVIGCYLSFAHQSVEFGLAFCLSVLAASCVIRNGSTAKGIAYGAFFLALSLGLYQVELACFCLVLLAYFVLLLFRGEEKAKLRCFIAKSLGSAVCGAALYWLVLQVILKLSGVAMAEYQGGASISPLNMVKNLPQSIAKCYGQFWDYFFGDTVRHNTLQNTKVLYVLAFVFVGAALFAAAGRHPAQKGCGNGILCGGCAAGDAACQCDFSAGGIGSDVLYPDGWRYGAVLPGVFLAAERRAGAAFRQSGKAGKERSAADSGSDPLRRRLYVGDRSAGYV